MAIINRPGAKAPEEPEAPPQGIVPRAASVPYSGAAAAPTASAASNGAVGAVFKLIGGLLLVAALGFAGYLGYQHLVSTQAEQANVQVDVTLDIERTFRVGGLIDLLERKIAQNQRALTAAEKAKDQVLIDTMRLALAQNLQDIGKHQDAFVETLTSLHGVYEKDSEAVLAGLKKALTDSEGGYRVGRADTVARVTQLLQSVPAGESAKRYFQTAVKPQE